ncbi:MAG: hypothetical protein AAGI38_00620 [Bacteroidota bacterium]
MKRLPSLFVILLSCSAALLGFLWMKERNIRAEMERQNQKLLVDVARQTEFLQAQTNDLYRKILLEVEEEVKNMAKKDNLGLVDTAKMIHGGAQNLFISDTLSTNEVDKWSTFLEQVYSQNSSSDQVRPIPDFSASLPAVNERQKLQLLEWEYETLLLLSTRFGNTGSCWGGNRSLVLSHIHKASLVEGDSFEAELFVVDDSEEWVERREPTTLFEASLGIIKKGRNGRPQLTIPTEGLLQPDEEKKLVPFEVTVRVSKSWGGHEKLRYYGEFWVVRG